MKKNSWEIVHDCDEEDTGEPTCWAREINHKRYGKYVWVNKYSDVEYGVEVIPESESKTLVTCKSLTSAKSWVSKNLV